MPALRDDERRVKDLLEGFSVLDVREMSIEALRRWRHNNPDDASFRTSDGLGRFLGYVLAERKRVDVPAGGSLQEPFRSGLHLEWMRPVLVFLKWLTAAGLGLDLTLRAEHKGDAIPFEILLTDRGNRLLETRDDHPLLPRFLERVRTRCPDLPGEVIELLADALACLERGLRRPAVVLMGVAYETAIEAIVEDMITKAHLPSVLAKTDPGLLVKTDPGSI